MAFSAKIITDSIDEEYKNRLTTFELTYPRIVHAEQMTHRVFSRNSASTRAIPLFKQIENLVNTPFTPEKFGVNQRGMQSAEDLSGLKHEQAVDIWLGGLARSVTTVIELSLGKRMAGELLNYNPANEYVPLKDLKDNLKEILKAMPRTTDEFDASSTDILNIHKQLAGRGLEAYMWHTVIVTATEFENFFALRNHEDAQGEIATIARMMQKAYEENEPKVLYPGQWHTPYVDEGEFEAIEDAIIASGARCAAVSYNRQAAKNHDAEVDRYWSLRSGGHMSPLEHQATPFREEENSVRFILKEQLGRLTKQLHRNIMGHESIENEAAIIGEEIRKSLDMSGNFKGWRQHRKFIAHEDNFGAITK